MSLFHHQIVFCLVFGLSVIFTNGASINFDVGLESRIVGGAQAEEGAIPYQVSLRLNGWPFCGGSIITVLHIVTAAHCVPGINISQLTVITGTNSLESGGETHGVVEVTSHESYVGSSDYWKYDIAILTLATELTVTSLQSPIPIATVDPPDGAELLVSGWGRLFSESNAVPTKLQYLWVVAINNTECRETLREEVDDVHLCALRGVGSAVCSGDSGGPLVYNGTLVGVVSWGRSPCASGVPDAYVRMSLMLDFIERVIGTAVSK
ncbi:trypsin delta-like [Neodiprion fabricii]|uniref:trypsin delta-like n=1 Tax=Neodiprion fabricii TaxID=2872261 RepID=UPI001ED90FD4|nr:trypsin delta-like [Neodiprion fabricii]